MQRLRQQFASAAAQHREKLYWKMIANGQLPSEGWTIGERMEMNASHMIYECWPVPPRGKHE